MAEPSTKLEALKSTSIIGGATAITMLVRMVRTKVLAILLGPAGVGIEAIFDSALTLVRTIFDLGMSGAGVRQIAAASDDPERISATVRTLRRSCLVLGCIGAVALFAGRGWVSRAAFGHTGYSTAFGWLSITLLLGAISGGRGALLQGMLRIGDLARMSIVGSILGAACSIPIVFLYGQKGIPAYMVLASGVGALTAWYYSRRIVVQPLRLNAAALSAEVRGLLRLGIAFMLTSLLSTGAAFLVRAMVIRQYGLESAGHFQAANALSLVFVGFVLQAMGTDFYPRLTAVAGDNAKCNRIVNEQAEISLMLALPGILATVALAPWAIRVFYSVRFGEAAEILVWQMGGMLLRVMSWPLGFMALAKGRSSVFFWTDAAAWSAYVGLAWLGSRLFGLPGVGGAFFVLYAFHVVLMYCVATQLSGFRWSPHYLRYAAVSLSAALLVIWARLLWPEPWSTLVCSLVASAAGLHSLRKLVAVVGTERIERMLARLRLTWILGILPQRLIFPSDRR
jgi:PST family polysaccharide transporter